MAGWFGEDVVDSHELPAGLCRRQAASGRRSGAEKLVGHYIPAVSRVLFELLATRSDDRLCDTSGLRVDAEDLADGPLHGFGLRGSAHMQSTSVGPGEGGGDA